jgi:5-enolpyruvylshikimate-3-phosphate synthase
MRDQLSGRWDKRMTNSETIIVMRDAGVNVRRNVKTVQIKPRTEPTRSEVMGPDGDDGIAVRLAVAAAYYFQ